MKKPVPIRRSVAQRLTHFIYDGRNTLEIFAGAYHSYTEALAQKADSDEPSISKRLETKKLITQLKKDNPTVESNIFNSIGNVNLDTVIGYKKNGVRYSFLDDYDVPER